MSNPFSAAKLMISWPIELKETLPIFTMHFCESRLSIIVEAFSKVTSSIATIIIFLLVTLKV